MSKSSYQTKQNKIHSDLTSYILNDKYYTDEFIRLSHAGDFKEYHYRLYSLALCLYERDEISVNPTFMDCQMLGMKLRSIF